MERGDEIRIGVIGCGGFGLFALQHFLQLPGLRLAGMAGTHREAAIAAAKRFGVPDVEDVDRLVARSDIDLVYIATPPFLHHRQALAALQAGKHVICEKPFALTLAQADEMIATAGRHDRLVVANLMQRYNPLAEAVGRLIQSQALGQLLHGYFENYAADEGLPPEHWFWDREKSGGIFVEHGVHFFDLFADWLGQGRVVAAQAACRPATDIEEHVHCTVQYGDGILVNFYHGFHQPGRLDRQELRLVFERGDVALFDWVPSRLRIHAVVDEAATRALCELFPAARLDITQVYAPKDRACHGRHQPIDAYQMIELTGDQSRPKMHRYGDLLRALLADQLAWVRDRDHRRRLTEQDSRDSLAMALAADRLAHPPRCPVVAPRAEAAIRPADREPKAAVGGLSRQLLVRPQDVTPSHADLEVIGTFNPGVAHDADQIVLMVRVAERPQQRREGFTALPRWDAGRVVVEWVADDELEPLDARVVRRRADGLLRLTFTSHLRVMRSRDGHTIDQWDVAAFLPQEPWEAYGVEDPRIVRIGDRYWITYVAVSRHGAATALASTRDFVTFQRHGIIFCPENKDVILFPETVGGRYVALHRPTPAHPFCRPEVWLASSPDLLHWSAHEPVHGGTADWETDRVGGGAPPLKTEAGWLEIYHGSRRSDAAGQVGAYAAGAMLLDLQDPTRVVGRTRQPLWEPEAPYECSGFVPQVVFPTGVVARDERLQIYYGAADTYAAVAELPLDEVIRCCCLAVC